MKLITLAVKIFVSSKIKFLKTERNLAEKIIKSHKFEPIRCENWGAATQHTEDICRSKVRDSHIIIFILGRHYSAMTENEYERARGYISSRHKVTLPFDKPTNTPKV